MSRADDDDPLLTPEEVGAMFRVDPKTVSKWAKAELIPAIRTPGGRWRFRTSVIKARLEEQEGGAG